MNPQMSGCSQALGGAAKKAEPEDATLNKYSKVLRGPEAEVQSPRPVYPLQNRWIPQKWC